MAAEQLRNSAPEEHLLPFSLQIEEDVRKELAGKAEEEEELPEWERYKRQVGLRKGNRVCVSGWECAAAASVASAAWRMCLSVRTHFLHLFLVQERQERRFRFKKGKGKKAADEDEEEVGRRPAIAEAGRDGLAEAGETGWLAPCLQGSCSFPGQLNSFPLLTLTTCNSCVSAAHCPLRGGSVSRATWPPPTLPSAPQAERLYPPTPLQEPTPQPAKRGGRHSLDEDAAAAQRERQPEEATSAGGAGFAVARV